MANSRAKEVSESYKGSEITFDKTRSGAVAKGFTSTDVQTAIEESKSVGATFTIAGLVRAASDTEAYNGHDVNAYVQPDQMVHKIMDYANKEIIPKIPAIPAIPSAVWGGNGTSAQMQSTYSYLPVGSLVAFNEQYTEAYGWGNGTAYRTSYRRRTLVRTSNAGWQWVM